MYDDTWLCIPNTVKFPPSALIRQAMLPVTNAGNPQDVLLIYGEDWNPAYAYYSGRKAIMDWRALPLDDPSIRASLANLSPDQHIAAMVIGEWIKPDDLFIQKRVQEFHLDPKPVMVLGDKCYLRKP
jgi:hypothetical protein